MPKVRLAVDIDAPVARVWELIANEDFDVPEGVRVEHCPPGPVAKGSIVKLVKDDSQQVVGTVECVQFEPPREIVTECVQTSGDKQVRLTRRIRLEPHDAGTRLHLDARISMPSLMGRVLGVLASGSARRAMQEELNKLKARAEG
jgi:uncharacterized protein YndB with AHSA1/START domain